LLFGLTGQDPVAIIGAAVVLVGVACVASVPPVLRAISMDPLRVLRTE
jgi:ABC-type lipoprotein release transport system permease subunit